MAPGARPLGEKKQDVSRLREQKQAMSNECVDKKAALELERARASSQSRG